jgi:hypothetical protein
MGKPLITKRSGSATSKLPAAQTSVTLAPRAKEASMSSRIGVPRGVLALATGVVLLAVLGFSASAASSRNQAPRLAKPFHLTKECSGFPGTTPGGYCTIRSSNVKAIKVGSKIFYFQPDTKTGTNSDMVIYAGRGTVATGHCDVASATGLGLCTISDGTGALAGFHMRVHVSPDKTVPNLWRWDGTYGFGRG